MPRAIATETNGRLRLSGKRFLEPLHQRGLHPLGLRSKKDAYLYVPSTYEESRRAPLIVLLHGAGGNGRGMLSILYERAESNGIILLAPTSAAHTWDFLMGGFGPDVIFIEQAMNKVSGHFQIDSEHRAIGGFSDGASYALTLGLANGDLFTHILAFSPGFMAPPSKHGSPKVYISHGIDDHVLPIDRCSRRILSSLNMSGYQIIYHEFNGPHTVPESVAAESIKWFLEKP